MAWMAAEEEAAAAAAWSVVSRRPLRRRQGGGKALAGLWQGWRRTMRLSDTPATDPERTPPMFRKTLAAIAVAGSLLVMAPRAAIAEETATRPAATAEVEFGAKRDAIAQQALSDIERRLAGDPALVRQIQGAAAKGDTVRASSLLAVDGAEVVSVGTEAAEYETNRLTIRVRVTVCVTVWGTTYCGTIIVTINLD